MKRWICALLAMLLACAMTGAVAEKTSDEGFDYSVFEEYEPEDANLWSYEVDKFDSEWDVSSFGLGVDNELIVAIMSSGDLDGDCVKFMMAFTLYDNIDVMEAEKVQILIGDNVYTFEGTLISAGCVALLHGENGKAFMEALTISDEFSVRVKTDEETYEDTFT